MGAGLGMKIYANSLRVREPRAMVRMTVASKVRLIQRERGVKINFYD
jgi:hypothetical protein